MGSTLNKLFENAQCAEREGFEPALSDLRFLIERYTMNRYGDNEMQDYLDTFYDNKLVRYHLEKADLGSIKYFLFFLLLNYPDRATLVAKCIKVLFDNSIREAICAAIEIYMEIDDCTTCELIFAITDVGDEKIYLSNKRVSDLFLKISKYGGKLSQEAVNGVLNK